MSRIGKKPVIIPANVQVTVREGVVTVKGPKAELKEPICSGLNVNVDGNLIQVERKDSSRDGRSNHGLMRTLIQNMVKGVSEEFKKELTITGVGYRANVVGSVVELSLGFSHPVNYSLPKGISAEYDKKANTLLLKGAVKEVLGLAAANIRSYRGPEPYKGKGIRYSDEVIRRKAGKSAGGK